MLDLSFYEDDQMGRKAHNLVKHMNNMLSYICYEVNNF